MKVSTATRLSISLVALTLSVLLAAQAIGLIPDPADAALKGGAHLCESLALSCSMAAQRGNFDEVRDIAGAILLRNPELRSLGLRRADGKLLVDTGGHAGRWNLRTQERSSDGFVQVPIFQGEKQWGTLELCFHPLRQHGLRGFLEQPILQLLVFIASLGYVAYLLYLRKTLRYLDPSSVIPERVKAMLDTLAEGVLVLDRRERVVLANDAFGSLVGRPASQLAGLAAATLPWSKTKQNLNKEDFPWAQTLRTGIGHRGSQISLASGGVERRLVLSCAPIHAENRSTRGVLLTFDDVTEIESTNAQLRETLDMLGRSRDEIERQNKELQALATTDPLTGCRNRRSFHAEFQSRWGAAKRYSSSLACVMVDVDFFKKVNDRFGHSTGDQVLQHVAGILRSLARESDMVCRYGGEEFCMLLPEADVVAAAQAAERFRAMIESKACGGVSVTASVGVSALELGADSPQALLDEADKCLYAAKRAGRNRVVRWDEVRDTPAAEGAPAAATLSAMPVYNKSSAPISFHAVTALMSALAHRDKGTADHSRRVADLCAAAAVGLMSVKDRFVLEVGALLHDIGKLGVPDAILLKPGALNEQEWTIMRSHDRMGVEIISAAFGSSELTEIVRTHHAQYATEAFDPALPKGRDIPLGARILALADAYDAMVSDRPYRGGRDRDHAFEELRRCAGGQFDPDLVEPFIAAVLARDRAAHGRLNVPPDGAPQTEAASSESVRDETALRLRLEVERLAWAAEARDLACLAEVARQVAATAAVDGLGDFAERVRELERMATDQGTDVDYDALTHAVNQLLDQCRCAGSLGPAEQQLLAKAS